MINSTQPIQKSRSLPDYEEGDRISDQSDQKVSYISKSLTAIPQVGEASGDKDSKAIRRRSVTMAEAAPQKKSGAGFSLFRKPKDQSATRPRSLSNAEESPRVKFTGNMKVAFLQKKRMSIEEIEKNKPVLIEKMLRQVPSEKVNLMARVGSAPICDMRNNYGITPDQGTEIKEAEGLIDFFVDGKLFSVKSPPAWTDNQQVFPIQESSIFADVAKGSEHPEGYEGTRSFVIADGCNWGMKAQTAAKTASAVALRVIDERLKNLEKTNTQEIARIHLEAFQIAQEELLKLKAPEKATYEELKELTRLGKIAGKTTLTIATIAERFLIVTRLGDSNVMLLRKISQKLQCLNVTPESRSDSIDARDCGGCLGQNNSSRAADWRNLAISVTELKPHDIVVGCTDGILDCFDPELLGYTPLDFNCKEDHWDPQNTIHSDLRQHKLNRGIAKVAGSDVKMIPSNLIRHVSYVVRPTQLYLLENPTRGEPKDYKVYKGKSDHTSVAAFRYEPI